MVKAAKFLSARGQLEIQFPVERILPLFFRKVVRGVIGKSLENEAVK